MIRRAAFILSLCACFAAVWALAAPAPPPDAPDWRTQRSFDVMIPMRDGVRLSTLVKLPAEGDGPWPAVMQRTPYDKNRGANAGENFTKRGYAYVIQDVRGLFASEGEYKAFENDQNDGYDTVEWIAAQPWSSGKVGATGGSAGGITATQAVMSRPPHLTCAYVTVSHGSSFRFANNSGGVFFQAMVEGWMKGRGIEPSAEPRPLMRLYDDEARRIDIRTYADKIDIPMYNVGGWFDIFSQGNIDAFQSLAQNGKQKLVMGPFGHGQLGGDLRYLERGEDRRADDQMRFLDYWLKGVDDGFSKEPAVHYYVMGDGMNGGKGPGNEWRTANSWPPPSKETRYYFQPAGGLAPGKPAEAGADSYIYDPNDSVKTIGGPNLNISKGPMDQRPLSARKDILRYETAPLEEPVEVVGRVKAELWVSTDAEDTDFMVKLIDVYPNGYEAILLDQPLRLRYREGSERWAKVTPGEVYPIEVDLWSTAQVFAPGHKIAVHVTSSNAPRFERHTNTWQPLASYEQAVKAKNTVYRSEARPSAIVLPLTSE
jgi:predicted acyl esterase